MEKMKKTSKKTLIIAVSTFLVLVIAFVGAMGSSSAFLEGTDIKEHLMRVKAFFFQHLIVENFPTPIAPSPGGTYEKEPWVENESVTPAFVRVMVLPVLSYEKVHVQTTLGDQVQLVGFNSADWIDGGDGYFYYNKILPGKSGGVNGATSSLFTDVELSEDFGGEYRGANLTIKLISEVVDTNKWNYRMAWWNTYNSSGLSGAIATVDAALAALATG
ncbi:MAG: hypothetical protein FWG82_00820 [Oscillospiraceae bacterium]|nr:hypothetical protein [Oscillospiraceae bacterium]